MIIPNGVLIPQKACAAVAERLLRDARRQADVNGVAGIPEWLRRLAEELNVVARDTGSSEVGTVVVPMDSQPARYERLVDRSVFPGLSAREAAVRLGVSAEYIRRLCRTGSLPGAWQADGGAWLIPAEAVSEFRLEKAG